MHITKVTPTLQEAIEMKQEEETMQKNLNKTLRQSSTEYIPVKVRNVAELDRCPVDAPIKVRTFEDKDGTPFNVHVVTVDGYEYRVPDSVRRDLKEIMTVKPNTKWIKVLRSGQGKQTSYTVVSLD